MDRELSEEFKSFHNAIQGHCVETTLQFSSLYLRSSSVGLTLENSLFPQPPQGRAIWGISSSLILHWGMLLTQSWNALQYALWHASHKELECPTVCTVACFSHRAGMPYSMHCCMLLTQSRNALQYALWHASHTELECPTVCTVATESYSCCILACQKTLKLWVCYFLLYFF
jgi:hypothetical protein